MTIPCDIPTVEQQAFAQTVLFLDQNTGLGLLAASVIVGPSNFNEITVKVTGLAALSGIPRYIALQARQQDLGTDYCWLDVFALQVVGYDYSSLTFRVKRLDSPAGWGQELQVDMLLGLQEPTV
jgi:hypothetical protein